MTLRVEAALVHARILAGRGRRAHTRSLQSAADTRPATVPVLISNQIVASVAIPGVSNEPSELRAVEVSDTALECTAL